MSKRVALVALVACAFAVSVSVSFARTPHLSTKRFKAVDAMLTSQIALDTPKPSGTAIAVADRACRKLNSKDPLLAAIRHVCSDGVVVVKRTGPFRDCTETKGCLATASSLRGRLQTFVGALAPMNTAINKVLSAGPCRTSLRASSHDIAEAKALVAALQHLERALKSGDKDDLSAAKTQLDAAVAMTAQDPSAKSDRAKFRKACHL